MKVLHVAQDREIARVPPGAFHGIAQNVTVAWAGSPADALEWLRRNTDAAAVIVEVEAQSGAPFVRELRAARLDTPLVVVGSSGRLDTAMAALNSGADAYLPAGPSLERELPELVVQAIERAAIRTRERAEMAEELAAHRRQLGRENRTCAELQQQSLQLEQALARLEQRRAREAAGFAELLDVRRVAFEERYAQVAESRDALAAELAEARLFLERGREARADAEAAAAARFADLESRYNAALEEHAAVAHERDAAYAALERTLADVQSAYQTLSERASAERADAEAARASLDGMLMKERQRSAELELDLAALRAAHVESERRHAEENAAALAQYADLESRHRAALDERASVTAEHDVAYAALERNLAEAQSNYQTLFEGAAADRAAAEEELAVAVAGRQQSEHRANRIIAAALAREAELIAALETESAAKAVAESHASAARMEAARGRDRSLLVVSKY